jgi:serine/threonine protein kinase
MGHHLDWPRRLGMALDAAKVPEFTVCCLLPEVQDTVGVGTHQRQHILQGSCHCTMTCRPSCATCWMQGLLQLHSHRPAILHRDLKSPNLLVDKHWRVKVPTVAAMAAEQLHHPKRWGRHAKVLRHCAQTLVSKYIPQRIKRCVQVGDFNLSRTAGSALTNSNLSANNPRWLAPEVITHQVWAEDSATVVTDLHCAPAYVRASTMDAELESTM